MTEDDDPKTAHREARAMLDAFASVGATRFEVTWIDLDEQKIFFRRRSLAELTRSIPGILDTAARNRHNVIVRPRGNGVSFIQLDDLPANKDHEGSWRNSHTSPRTADPVSLATSRVCTKPC